MDECSQTIVAITAGMLETAKYSPASEAQNSPEAGLFWDRTVSLISLINCFPHPSENHYRKNNKSKFGPG